MAVDLASIDPSEFIEFRDTWVKECGLENAADRLFDDVGLSELVELDNSELAEYAKEIGLSVIERKRLLKGIRKLTGLEPSRQTPTRPQSARSALRHTPTLSISASEPPTATHAHSKSMACGGPGSRTPTSDKFRKSRKKDKKSKKSKRRRAKTSGNRASMDLTLSPYASEEVMYDPTAQKPRTPEISATNKSPSVRQHSPLPYPRASNASNASPEGSSEISPADVESRISEALQQIAANAASTKEDIRRTFLELRSKITERELRLLQDVDSTLDKKQRLLQTQLDYIRENQGGGATELVADPGMKLEMDRHTLLRSLITAGWVQGATTDNKEEQELQERERKRRELARQQFLTVERLKQITLHERECAAKREDSVRLTDEVHSEIAKINLRTSKCEAELAEAKPLMEAAKKLVSRINKKQLDEIRVLKKPPAVVELVCSAVAIMLGNEIASWRDIQKVMGDRKFIPSMLQFDTMRLKRKTREECVKYTKHEDFNEERANKASKVAGPLVKWVKSQIKYSELLDIVRPMQKEIKVLRKRLDKKQKQLKVIVELVNELESKISRARADINSMVDNMIKMQDEYDLQPEDADIATKIECHTQQLYNTISL